MARGSEGDRWIDRLPADLAAVLLLVVLANLVVLAPILNESPVRVVLGLAFVLVLPGYAFVAALFPGHGRAGAGTDAGATDETRRGIDGIERAALSLALSIPVVALVGLALSLTPLGVGLASVLPAVSAVTLAATAIAARRRSQLPASERFRVPYREWLAAGRAALFQAESRADLALSLLLAASVLLAVTAVSYALVAPTEGEPFTEFYMLTENDSGELVAENYPTNFTVGEARPLTLGVENHEHEPVGYTVLTQLQRVRIDGNESTVVETQQLDRFSVRLSAGEVWRSQRSVRPTMAGDRLRLVYLLYREAPPDDPSISNAYRYVDLWVTVRE